MKNTYVDVFGELFLVNYKRLGCKPFLLLLVGHHAVLIDAHLTDHSVRCLTYFEATVFSKFLRTFYVFKFPFVRVVDTFLAVSHVVHKTVFQKEASCDWIDRLSVHLLNIFDVASDRYLVCRFNKTNPRQDSQVSHFLNCKSNLAMN